MASGGSHAVWPLALERPCPPAFHDRSPSEFSTRRACLPPCPHRDVPHRDVACLLPTTPYKARFRRELNGRALDRRPAQDQLVRRTVFPPSEHSSLSRGLKGFALKRG